MEENKDLVSRTIDALSHQLLSSDAKLQHQREQLEKVAHELKQRNDQAVQRAKQAQLQGAMIATTIAIAAFTVVLFWFDEQLGIRSAGLSNAITLLLLAIALLAFSSLIVYFYLRGWVTKLPSTAAKDKNKNKDSELDTLKERVEALEHAPPPSSDGQALSSSDVVQKLLPQVSAEIAQLFEERFERKSAEHRAAAENARRFDAAATRLEREIKEQGRKGNVNLSIGLFTTGLAIILLVSMAVMAHTPFDSMQKVVAHYLPWLSVTIFIEVFSFFFLRLYKATLDEARRYNDDLTRLTLQWVATDTGRFSSEPTALAALAKELIDVSKPPKLASAEASKPAIDTDKALKALLDTLSKQLDTKTKRSAKGEATKTDEDD